MCVRSTGRWRSGLVASCSGVIRSHRERPSTGIGLRAKNHAGLVCFCLSLQVWFKVSLRRDTFSCPCFVSFWRSTPLASSGVTLPKTVALQQVHCSRLCVAKETWAYGTVKLRTALKLTMMCRLISSTCQRHVEDSSSPSPAEPQYRHA